MLFIYLILLNISTERAEGAQITRGPYSRSELQPALFYVGEPILQQTVRFGMELHSRHFHQQSPTHSQQPNTLLPLPVSRHQRVIIMPSGQVLGN